MKNLLSCAVTFIVLLGLVQRTVGAPVLEDHVLLTSGKGGYHTGVSSGRRAERTEDDLLVLARTRRDARFAARRLQSAARRLRLCLGSKGIRIVRVNRGICWLGAIIQTAEVFAALDQRVHGNVRWLLQRCTGLKGTCLRQRHFVRLPRGFGTWQVRGVRLVNLSAMPPTRPREYPRPPQWQSAGHRRRSGSFDR